MIREVNARKLPDGFIEIFSSCLGRPGEASEIVGLYEEPGWRLFAIFEEREIVAVAGLKLDSPSEHELVHLAVKKERRSKGLGKRIIDILTGAFRLSDLFVWTDDEAVGFYRSIGFRIIQEETTLHGIKRYKLARYGMYFSGGYCNHDDTIFDET